MPLDYLIPNHSVYISVNPDNTAKIQTFLFSLGYTWHKGKIVQYERDPYLCIHRNSRGLTRNSSKSENTVNITDIIMELMEPTVKSYEYW